MTKKAQQAQHLGRPRDDEARAARRQKILEGARACFVQKGFHASSIAMIGEEAGVSVANIYQYFETKDDLIVALVEEELKADLAVVRLLEDAPNLHGGLNDAVSRLLSVAETQSAVQLRLEVLAESFRNPVIAAVVKRGEKLIIAVLARILAAAQARGEVRADLDPLKSASFIQALCDGLLCRLPVSPRPLREVSDEALIVLRSHLGLKPHA
jgi:AcrR family transcriptional regulator